MRNRNTLGSVIMAYLVLTMPALATIWNVSIKNTVVPNANDLELIFSGTGGGIAKPSLDSVNNGTPGKDTSATVSTAGNGVNLDFGAAGFAMNSTLSLSFTTPSPSDLVAFSKGTWTRKTNNGVDVPPSAVTVADAGGGGGALWRVVGINNSVLAADDFEATFAGANGSISNAMVTTNPMGAGSASTSVSGDLVTVDWGPPGLPNGGATFVFTFQTIPGSTVSLVTSEWTNNVTMSDNVVVSAVPEPNSFVFGGVGVLGLLGFASVRRCASLFVRS